MVAIAGMPIIKREERAARRSKAVRFMTGLLGVVSGKREDVTSQATLGSIRRNESHSPYDPVRDPT